MHDVIDLYDMVLTGVYVDDISQMVVGAVRFVSHLLACADAAFVRIAQSLKLVIVDPGIVKTKTR